MIFHHSFDHINNFIIIICDRIKINCHHMFIRNPMMCVKWDQMGNVISVKDGRRFLPIHELCSSLSEITCRVLPVAHALSGCDTTSSFFGIGKKSVYKILKAPYFHDLDSL
jgi:hypothetical protein